jgi:hypothetical protein
MGILTYNPSLKNYVHEDSNDTKYNFGLLDSEKEIYYTHVLKILSKTQHGHKMITTFDDYTDTDHIALSFKGIAPSPHGMILTQFNPFLAANCYINFDYSMSENRYVY